MAQAGNYAAYQALRPIENKGTDIITGLFKDYSDRMARKKERDEEREYQRGEQERKESEQYGDEVFKAKLDVKSTVLEPHNSAKVNSFGRDVINFTAGLIPDPNEVIIDKNKRNKALEVKNISTVISKNWTNFATTTLEIAKSPESYDPTYIVNDDIYKIILDDNREILEENNQIMVKVGEKKHNLIDEMGKIVKMPKAFDFDGLSKEIFTEYGKGEGGKKDAYGRSNISELFDFKLKDNDDAINQLLYKFGDVDKFVDDGNGRLVFKGTNEEKIEAIKAAKDVFLNTSVMPRIDKEKPKTTVGGGSGLSNGKATYNAPYFNLMYFDDSPTEDGLTVSGLHHLNPENLPISKNETSIGQQKNPLAPNWGNRTYSNVRGMDFVEAEFVDLNGSKSSVKNVFNEYKMVGGVKQFSRSFATVYKEPSDIEKTNYMMAKRDYESSTTKTKSVKEAYQKALNSMRTKVEIIEIKPNSSIETAISRGLSSASKISVKPDGLRAYLSGESTLMYDPQDKYTQEELIAMKNSNQ